MSKKVIGATIILFASLFTNAQDQKVKDSNYSMSEIKKMDAIERDVVKMGLAKKLGSAWYKDKTPKEVHSKYQEYGYSWYGE
jgi:hypothetical protein